MAKLPPPVEHQFKKGNKGKPKGALNIKTRIIKALLKKVEYPDISKPKIKGKNRPKITGQMIDFIISSLIQQAIKGNTRAFEILLDRTGIHLESDNDEKHEPNKFEIHIIDPNGYLKEETNLLEGTT